MKSQSLNNYWVTSQSNFHFGKASRNYLFYLNYQMCLKSKQRDSGTIDLDIKIYSDSPTLHRKSSLNNRYLVIGVLQLKAIKKNINCKKKKKTSDQSQNVNIWSSLLFIGHHHKGQ